jgi:hypothetical protein
MLISKQIGKNAYVFTVEGNNLFELVQESQKLSFNDVYKCGLCSSDKLGLRSYITEKGGYEYVKIQCNACGGQVTFGKNKEKKDSFFLRKNPEDHTLIWEAKIEKGE